MEWRNKLQSQDIVASFVVFLVALPLSLGIGLASGVPPSAAIVSAVVGGLLVGLISGAPLVVTGPAAGLTTMVFQAVQTYGMAGLAVATIFAGLIQVFMGRMKLGRWFVPAPKPVLEGMLSAIGLIILFSQVHVLMGQQSYSSPVSAIVALPESLSLALSDRQAGMFAPALFCGLFAVAIQLVWPRIARRLPSTLASIPGSLPAVALATPLSLLWSMPRVELDGVGGGIDRRISSVASTDWLSPEIAPLIWMGLLFALVASAETMLSARALQSMVVEKFGVKAPPLDLDRELTAQGVGNLASGLVGGIPMTGVIVRSAVNLNAGAKTRASTILHGVWILLALVFFSTILAKIPLAALASVLVLTGVKLFNPRGIMHALKHESVDGTIWLVTMVAILSTSLLTGLLIGLAVSLFATYASRAFPRGGHAG